jgi:hypothetical protein
MRYDSENNKDFGSKKNKDQFIEKMKDPVVAGSEVQQFGIRNLCVFESHDEQLKNATDEERGDMFRHAAEKGADLDVGHEFFQGGSGTGIAADAAARKRVLSLVEPSPKKPNAKESEDDGKEGKNNLDDEDDKEEAPEPKKSGKNLVGVRTQLYQSAAKTLEALKTKMEEEIKRSGDILAKARAARKAQTKTDIKTRDIYARSLVHRAALARLWMSKAKATETYSVFDPVGLEGTSKDGDSPDASAASVAITRLDDSDDFAAALGQMEKCDVGVKTLSDLKTYADLEKVIDEIPGVKTLNECEQKKLEWASVLAASQELR